MDAMVQPSSAGVELPTDAIRVECFMTCDGAQESNGKLYVLGGGWDTLLAETFPATRNQMALAIRLAVPWQEANRPLLFRVELRDDDERNILTSPLEGTVTLGRPPQAHPADRLPVVMAFTLQQITFPNHGAYTFHLLIDDRVVARCGLRARVTSRLRPPAAPAL